MILNDYHLLLLLVINLTFLLVFQFIFQTHCKFDYNHNRFIKYQLLFIFYLYQEQLYDKNYYFFQFLSLKNQIVFPMDFYVPIIPSSTIFNRSNILFIYKFYLLHQQLFFKFQEFFSYTIYQYIFYFIYILNCSLSYHLLIYYFLSY